MNRPQNVSHGVYERNHLLHCPYMIGQARLHRRGVAQGRMDAAEVVVHEVNCQHLAVVLDFL